MIQSTNILKVGQVVHKRQIHKIQPIKKINYLKKNHKSSLFKKNLINI